MKFKAMTTIAFALVPVAGVVTLTLALGTGVVSVSASGRTRQLHVTKECSQNTGLAGSFCTITSSNVRESWLARVSTMTRRLVSRRVAGQQRHRRLTEWKQSDRPLHTRPRDPSRTVHLLGRYRKPRRVPCPCRRRLQVGMPLGRAVRLREPQ